MPFTQRNDNTRVQKPLIVQPIKKKLVRRVKNEEVKQDNRPQIIRQQAQSKSDAQYKQDKMQKAQDFTIQAMLRPLMVTDLSHMFGVITSDKPFIETFGNPEVQATNNDVLNFIIGSASPWGITKAGLIPLMMFRKGAFKKQFIGAFKAQKDRDFLNKQILSRTGKKMSVYDAYAANELPDQYQRTFEALIRRFNGELKAQDVSQIAKSERAITNNAKLDANKVKAIRQTVIDNKGTTYESAVADNFKKTGINWSDLDNQGMMFGMDDNLRLTKVGSANQPFLQRYYHNVVTHMLDNNGKEGFQTKILKSGDLRKNTSTKQWEGRYPDGNYYPVRRPEEYIKVRWAKEKGMQIELPIPDGTYHNFPVHGTITKNKGYLVKPSSSPGKNGYWTIRMDSKGQGSDAAGYYQKNGYAVPFYESPNLETDPFKAGTSYNLMKTLQENYSGRVMQPLNVKDANAPAQRVNEYIFSPTAPNPKSAWNTLDFEPGQGPLAYNKIQNNNNLA